MNLNDMPQTPAAAGALPAEDVHQRIGQLTRTLHNALRELGYDRALAQACDNLPDARDRLSYIARVTGEAAEKVLDAVDSARGVQDELNREADSLRQRWSILAASFAAGGGGPAGRELVDETCGFFERLGSHASATQRLLTEIMMAQDFHDLTGQVIRKVVALAGDLEEQLLKLLIETAPTDQRQKMEAERLQGPVVNATGRDDVVTNQAQVDDLLASLGF